MKSKEINLHKLAPLITLATSRDAFEATFANGFNPKALYDLGVDQTIVPEHEIKFLVNFEAEFKALHKAWEVLSEYEDPPCPKPGRVAQLIELTKTLGPDV